MRDGSQKHTEKERTRGHVRRNRNEDEGREIERRGVKGKRRQEEREARRQKEKNRKGAEGERKRVEK